MVFKENHGQKPRAKSSHLIKKFDETSLFILEELLLRAYSGNLSALALIPIDIYLPNLPLLDPVKFSKDSR